jgi:DNA-binding protein HU-beta
MMGKQAFVSEISRKLRLNKKEIKVEDFVETFLDTLEKFIVKGEKVTFQKLFSLSLVERVARKGKNPKTGKEIIIPKRKIVSFKVSPHLKEKINKHHYK